MIFLFRELKFIFDCRSAVVYTACNPKIPDCRRKQPVPAKKIYSQYTIEFGIFVDWHAYKTLSVRKRNANLL